MDLEGKRGAMVLLFISLDLDAGGDVRGAQRPGDDDRCCC